MNQFTELIDWVAAVWIRLYVWTSKWIRHCYARAEPMYSWKVARCCKIDFWMNLAYIYC